MRGLAIHHLVGQMSTWTAAVLITAALALGIYGARWWLAEHDEIAARARLANAVKVMWAARRALGLAVVAGVVVVGMWMHGKGR